VDDVASVRRGARMWWRSWWQGEGGATRCTVVAIWGCLGVSRRWREWEEREWRLHWGSGEEERQLRLKYCVARVRRALRHSEWR
jgi:hypothetical protein